MSNTWETAAIIRLVDHLSGPLKNLAGSVDKHATGMAASLQRTGTRMADVGRSMTFGLTLPLVEIGKKMTEQAVEFSKVENTLQGILLNRARTLKGLKTSYEDYAASQMKIMKDDASTAYERTGGLANVLEYKKAQMDAIKAGHDAEASSAVAMQSVYLALAGRTQQSEAAADILKLGMAFGVVTRNADGSSRSIAELNKEFGKVSDLVATMTTNSTLDYHGAVDSLRLAAPYAHLLGFDPGVLGAMATAMSEQNIPGSQASVAMRSFFQSLLGPKSTAVSTLEAAGVKYYDYVKFAPDFQLTPEAFANAAHRNGYDITLGQAKRAFAKARAKGVSSGGENDFLNDLGEELTGSLLHHGGKHTALTPEQTSKFTTGWMSRGVQRFDAPGLVDAIRGMHGGEGPTSGEYRAIGEGRQYSRS